MIAIILALASVIAYLEVANNNGTAKMDLIYPPAREARNEFNAEGPPRPVHSFGYTFGARNVD